MNRASGQTNPKKETILSYLTQSLIFNFPVPKFNLISYVQRTMVPVSKLVTAIITTSPTPSSPSTELITSVLQSFHQHCPDLAAVRVIVVFDTFQRITTQARLKTGSATPEIASSYNLYKENVKSLILRECYVSKNDDGYTMVNLQAAAEYGSRDTVALSVAHTEDKHITFIEPVERLGFGLAVRSALRLVETPYVWVQQHDWALVADIPLRPLLEVMQTSSMESETNTPVKYVSFPSVRMLQYAESNHVRQYPALRTATTSLKQDFTSTSSDDTSVTVKVPLTPLFFWHDKPHLASTEHYLARVFPSSLAMRKGDFIEDKTGQRARMQMKDGLWHKWACWLYYPDEGTRLCLRHLKGRTWKGERC